jgi:hypothetical protein
VFAHLRFEFGKQLGGLGKLVLANRNSRSFQERLTGHQLVVLALRVFVGALCIAAGFIQAIQFAQHLGIVVQNHRGRYFGRVPVVGLVEGAPFNLFGLEIIANVEANAGCLVDLDGGSALPSHT